MRGISPRNKCFAAIQVCRKAFRPSDAALRLVVNEKWLLLIQGRPIAWIIG